MENPATWRPAEKVIHKALNDFEESQRAGIIGRSKMKAIADALREAGLLVEDA